MSRLYGPAALPGRCHGSALGTGRRTGLGCKPARFPGAVIEIMRFRLVEGADVAGFRAADARLQTAFAYQQPGLLRRTTARSSDGGWVVIDIWRAAADADACEARWSADP